MAGISSSSPAPVRERRKLSRVAWCTCSRPARAGVSRRVTPRAVLWRISAYAIGAWKHDTLSAGGRLDPDRRAGGWGGISADIERQLGGQWTTRSRRTIEGLIRMASDHPSVHDVA